jgi:hypothetical protein
MTFQILFIQRYKSNPLGTTKIGHNLNLGHSNELGSYNDRTGMMGVSYFTRAGPRMCFNAAKSWQLGWYQQRQLIIDSNFPSYTGRIASIIDDPSETGPPMLIKLDTPTGDDYFINFNYKAGFNSGTKEGYNQVLVVQTEKGTFVTESELKAKLSANSSYKISAFSPGLDLTVEVISVNISQGFAEIQICLGECPPEPTQAPTRKPSSSPTHYPTFEPTTEIITTKQPTSTPTKSPIITPSRPPTGEPTVPGSGRWCGTLNYSLRASFCRRIVIGEKKCSDPLPSDPSKTLGALCPQECGVACDCYDLDSYQHKGKNRNCAWAIERNKCGKDKFDSYCPRSCGKCGPLLDQTEPPTVKPTKEPSTSTDKPWCGTLKHHKDTLFCKEVAKDTTRCSLPLASDPDKTVASLCPLDCGLECDFMISNRLSTRTKFVIAHGPLNGTSAGKTSLTPFVPNLVDDARMPRSLYKEIHSPRSLVLTSTVFQKLRVFIHGVALYIITKTQHFAKISPRIHLNVHFLRHLIQIRL